MDQAAGLSTKEAEEKIGGLSKTSKMPGYSYSIDARACITGSKLRKDPNSPCSKCYALKGRYLFSNVRNALTRRLDATKEKGWCNAMIITLMGRIKKDTPYFRWFDSGDLQGKRMLSDIEKIALRMPWVNFWLPSQEYDIVKGTKPPKNLVVRLSERTFGFKKTIDWPNTSSVAQNVDKEEWAELVKLNTPRRWHCPSSLQGNECLSCRACWKRNISHVVYPQH